jgi:hypothetical protein
MRSDSSAMAKGDVATIEQALDDDYIVIDG